jgi:hypothetical protein
MVLQTNFAEEAHQMLTKTRTTIIALVASASFGVASVAPAVSQAQDNSSSNSVSASMCQGRKDMAQHEIEEAAAAVGRGDYEAAAFWSESASEDAQQAEKWCAEAAAEGHALIKVVVAPGGAISTPVTTVFHPKKGKTRSTTTRHAGALRRSRRASCVPSPAGVGCSSTIKVGPRA